MDKPAVTTAALSPALVRRWSPRAFDPGQAVTHEQAFELLEAARWAPSCFGEQPWRYLICDRTGNPSAWETALTCLAEKNRRWAHNAPLLIISLADSTFAQTGKPNRWAQHDTGAASENLCIQAAYMGLAAHQMGGFDAQAVREKFGVPESVTPMAVIAVGYQADADSLDPEFRERELADRQRKPLDDFVFNGDWGTAVKFE